jgi:hypothetical protein
MYKSGIFYCHVQLPEGNCGYIHHQQPETNSIPTVSLLISISVGQQLSHSLSPSYSHFMVGLYGFGAKQAA